MSILQPTQNSHVTFGMRIFWKLDFDKNLIVKFSSKFSSILDAVCEDVCVCGGGGICHKRLPDPPVVLPTIMILLKKALTSFFRAVRVVLDSLL